jgi:DNA-binding response OmpR family regulator
MVSRPKVLLGDDNVKVLSDLEDSLSLEGFQVLCARDGEDALRKAASFDPDIMILDIRMPKIDGRQVLRRLRADGSRVAVLMLTEVTGAAARMRALDEGADDYMDKPFDSGELLARVRAILRRTRAAQPAGQGGRRLCCGRLCVDSQTRRVFLGKREARLKPKEVGVLEHLMRHAGELVEHDALVAAVWGPDAIVGTSSVYVGINHIRQFLDGDAGRSGTIETVAGLGYRFVGTVEVLP